MAAGDASAPFAEVINSLDESKIPDKLHCPACHKFLLDGWKVVCCDQTICGSCYSSITDHCPVCEHRPMSQDLCKPNKALRNTAKAYLKTAEKKLADERAKSEAANAPSPAVVAPTHTVDTPITAPPDSQVGESTTTGQDGLADAVKLEQMTRSPTQDPLADQPQPSIETPTIEASSMIVSTQDGTRPLKGCEELAGDPVGAPQQGAPPEEGKGSMEEEYKDLTEQDRNMETGGANGPFNMGINMNASGFPNMMNMNMNMNTSFNNPMDYNSMMQYMSANGMGNLNNMIGMPNMAMTTPMMQGMFGGFGGPNMGMAGMNGLNSMNGMNMGMNFNPGQGMYGAGWNGQTGNMWNGPQSNNPNAFSNGMGGDFGSNSGYGYNPSQQGTFHQHQYPNGDFQGGYQGRGFGRGRGRARGGYGRGRGGYGQAPQGTYTNYQHPYEQQQQEIQNMQAEMANNHAAQSESNSQIEPNVQSADDEQQAPLNFAPGGQDEVQEALGGDYSKAEATIETDTPSVGDATPDADAKAEAELERDGGGTAEAEPPAPDQAESVQPIPTLSPTTYEDDVPAVKEVPSVALEPESTETPMPPPSAPLGPAAQFADPARDHGFRGRGHGRLPSRGRGSFHALNGHPISPVKPAPAPPFRAPIEPKGTGVVGAPTGPKAMRAPAAVVSGPVRGRGGGFQIVGRASMTSRGSMSVASEKSRSVTPTNIGRDEYDHDSRSPSRQRSRHHRHSSRRETDTEEDRERRYDHKSRRSRKDEYEDYDMQDGAQERLRSATPEESQRSSHRREKDRDRHSSSTKHRSSRSHRHRDEAQDEADYDMDDHNAEPKSSRNDVENDSRSSRRDQDRDRDRDRDHHTSRSRRYDEKEREDSHRDRRKRSRREREDGGDVDEVEEESRHRSRRHKREHGHDHREESVNGRKGSERSSAVATPVEREPEKDMHTLEREARNRERMLKEQQRRENAMNAERGGGSGKKHGVAGGRRVSYKYEDEAQSAMVEQEREAARWR